MRKTKYDHAKIVKDYKKGMSIPEIREKYGIAISHAHRIIFDAGASRPISDALLVKAKGWRKLCPVGTTPSRILSLPACIIESLGIDSRKTLVAKWVVDKKTLTLNVKEDKR